MNLTIVRTLWSALLFSTFVELGIVLWGDFDRYVYLQVEITVAVAVVAATLAVASFLLPSRLYSAALERLALPVIEVPVQNNDAARDYRSAAGSQRVFREADAARSAMVRAFQAPFLVSVALAESIAILGVVIAQGRLAPSVYALPFFVVAWVLLGLRFPRVANVVEPAERLYSAQLAR